MGKIINGINVQHFISGWHGQCADTIPFDVESLLTTGQCVIIVDGVKNHITIDRQDSFFELSCKYLNKKRSFKLFREWDGMDIDIIIKMESYSLGECVRKILTGKNIL